MRLQKVYLPTVLSLSFLICKQLADKGNQSRRLWLRRFVREQANERVSLCMRTGCETLEIARVSNCCCLAKDWSDSKDTCTCRLVAIKFVERGERVNNFASSLEESSGSIVHSVLCLKPVQHLQVTHRTERQILNHQALVHPHVVHLIEVSCCQACECRCSDCQSYTTFIGIDRFCHSAGFQHTFISSNCHGVCRWRHSSGPH